MKLDFCNHIHNYDDAVTVYAYSAYFCVEEMWLSIPDGIYIIII